MILLGLAATLCGILPTQVALTPSDAKLIVENAEHLEASGQLPQATAAYDAVIAGGVKGYHLQRALYDKARACLAGDCATDATEAIQRLTSEFPESSFATAAGVLKAQLNHADARPAEALVTQETQATDILDAAHEQTKLGQIDNAMAALDYVLANHPGTAAALRATDAKGHLLLRKNQRSDATTAFRNIIDQVGATAPKSRVVQTAKLRLAAIYHTSKASQDRRDALALYQDLAADSASPYHSEAALASVGLEIELLPWQARVDKTIPVAQWESIRQKCRAVVQMPDAKPEEKIRADLFILESCAWQGDHDSAIKQASSLLNNYDPASFRQEIATARLFVGEQFQKLGRSQEAIDQYRLVIQAYPTEKEMWPEMDHLPRTLFRIWECLWRLNAPQVEIDQIVTDLNTRFPDSPYTRFVGKLRTQEVPTHAK